MDLTLELQALDVADLSEITLEELRIKINHANPLAIPKYRVLQVLMGWLHEQIVKDLQQDMLSGFANLLLTGNGLTQGPFDEIDVKVTLEQWLVNDAAKNPTNRRRYQMVKQDLYELCTQVKLDSSQNQHPQESTLEHSVNSVDMQGLQIFKDHKARRSRGRKRKGSKKTTLGKGEGPQGDNPLNTSQTMVKPKAEEGDKNESKKDKSEKGEELSRTSVGGMEDAVATGMVPAKRANTSGSHLTDNASNDPHTARASGTQGTQGTTVQGLPESFPSKPNRPLPPGYVCSYCHQPGK